MSPWTLMHIARKPMLNLDNVNLRHDPEAATYVKTEIVAVTFASRAGELISLEGPNRYRRGDALICGATGSRWSVARQKFDAKYEAVPPTLPGQDGRYAARPIPVLAKQIKVPSTAMRSAGGDLLRGDAGDWLLQYGPGDYGVAAHARFVQIYRLSP